MSRYDDIINFSRPKSKYSSASNLDRAAQFAPFAALTTHGDAIKETNRLTDEKKKLGDYELEEINYMLGYISNNIGNNLLVKVTYFLEDEKKDGGSYRIKEGYVKRIDIIKKEIIFNDNAIINFSDIIKINYS